LQSDVDIADERDRRYGPLPRKRSDDDDDDEESDWSRADYHKKGINAPTFSIA